jgi:2-polyprenyl-6-hydroxyphenyl methylase/3-demethylubiquinone-9 3-methyltransferase
MQRDLDAPSAKEYRYAPGTGWDPGALGRLIERLVSERSPGRVFELGCGNGSLAARLIAPGREIVAVDASESGIAQARLACPSVRFEVASAYDELASRFGRFDLVLSVEVIEHLYSPKTCVARIRDLLVPGGTLILTTPYHGYLKNLAIAALGKFDSHVDPLWEGGHIKFFSLETLTRLVEGGGLTVESVHRVGRIPPLAKSMVVVARKSE